MFASAYSHSHRELKEYVQGIYTCEKLPSSSVKFSHQMLLHLLNGQRAEPVGVSAQALAVVFGAVLRVQRA